MQNKHPIIRHYSIIIDANIEKNKPNIVTKSIRDTTELSPAHLIESYTPLTFKPEDIGRYVINSRKNWSECWMLWLHNPLHKKTPIKTTEKLQQPWFNKHIRQQHKVMNNCYQVWAEHKQMYQWTAYKTGRNIYNRLLMYHKKQTMSKKILENRKNTKQLFKIIWNR